MNPALEATLGKQYSSSGFTLDVELKCEPGVTVLFGASGAGKTLTLNLLSGLVRPVRGRILLGGELLCDAQRGVHVPPRGRGIGYVFQSEALFPHLTIEENLLFPLNRMGALERRRRVKSMLETFRLSAMAGRHPRDLSGGERQRASLARALVGDPRMLLLDEPARGLDYELRHDLYRVLREIRAQYAIPILVVTHDIPESFLLADRMCIYHQGRIVQEGPPETIYQAPRNRQVAQLLGFSNIFEGVIEHLDPTADESRIHTADFVVTAGYLPGRLRGDRVEFCISPQHVRLQGSGENSFPADLVQALFTPSTVRLLFRPPGSTVELECEITRERYQELQVSSQKQWTVTLPRQGLHVF